jgi:DNA-binding protein HU-beta
MADSKKASAKSTGGGAAKKSGKGGAAKASTGRKEKSVSELVAALAETSGLTKAKTKEFLEAHSALLVKELQQNGSVQLAGIGKLKLGERAARQGRNPSTGAAITIKARKTVKFAGGKAFKDRFQ